jgi:hypothetical protein
MAMLHRQNILTSSDAHTQTYLRVKWTRFGGGQGLRWRVLFLELHLQGFGSHSFEVRLKQGNGLVLGKRSYCHSLSAF